MQHQELLGPTWPRRIQHPEVGEHLLSHPLSQLPRGGSAPKFPMRQKCLGSGPTFPALHLNILIQLWTSSLGLLSPLSLLFPWTSSTTFSSPAFSQARLHFCPFLHIRLVLCAVQAPHISPLKSYKKLPSGTGTIFASFPSEIHVS